MESTARPPPLLLHGHYECHSRRSPLRRLRSHLIGRRRGYVAAVTRLAYYTILLVYDTILYYNITLHYNTIL